jgi:hypothetical protein
LASLSRAYATFKTPKKIKLGAMLSPSHIPSTPTSSDRLALTKLEAIKDSMEDDEQRLVVGNGVQTILAEWYKLDDNFELIQLELEASSRGETRYHNTVNNTVEDMLCAVNDMTSCIQVLAASIGTGVDDIEAGPMSLWEAVEDLRSVTRRIDGVTDGNYGYLDDLRKTLPNWSKTLGDLSKNYFVNLPKMNAGGLVGCRTRLDILEGTGPPSRISAVVDGFGGIRNQSFVLQADFNDTKRDLETTFVELRNTIAESGGSASSDPRIGKVLERLGDLEGRVTGEAFSMGSYVFCSCTEVADWIVAEQVPTAGVFWDLFSVLVSMKPKRQVGKDRSDESHSAKRTGSTILENDLAASMTHIRPELLYAKKGSGEIGRRLLWLPYLRHVDHRN